LTFSPNLTARIECNQFVLRQSSNITARRAVTHVLLSDEALCEWARYCAEQMQGCQAEDDEAYAYWALLLADSQLAHEDRLKMQALAEQRKPTGLRREADYTGPAGHAGQGRFSGVDEGLVLNREAQRMNSSACRTALGAQRTC
jgi:hypothetical protein